jgi:hypothetical protein
MIKTMRTASSEWRTRRRTLGCGIALLLTIGSLYLLMVFLTGSWKLQSVESQLHKRLYSSGDIAKLKSFAQAAREQDSRDDFDPSDELRAIGVQWISKGGVLQDPNVIQFEYGGGLFHFGVIIAPPDYVPEGSNYHKWEDGVYGYSE